MKKKTLPSSARDPYQKQPARTQQLNTTPTVPHPPFPSDATTSPQEAKNGAAVILRTEL